MSWTKKKQILTFFYWAGLQQKVRKEDGGGQESGRKGREEQEEGYSRLGHFWVQIQREWEKEKKVTDIEWWMETEKGVRKNSRNTAGRTEGKTAYVVRYRKERWRLITIFSAIWNMYEIMEYSLFVFISLFYLSEVNDVSTLIDKSICILSQLI